MDTLEAATELLLHAFNGNFAAAGQPWIRTNETSGKPWIDFEAIPENIGGSSSGERSLLLLAASIAADVPTTLGNAVVGLDRDNLDLVLAAIAHAGGSHEHSDMRVRSLTIKSRERGEKQQVVVFAVPAAQHGEKDVRPGHG